MERKKGEGLSKGNIAALIWLILIALATRPARAEETLSVGEVVVTATRYEEQVTDVPASVSVITSEEIRDSNAKNIPDILKTEPGVQVTDITGNSRSYTVDLRGFGETAALNTLVLVDGRRLNEADLSGADWLDIPLERVSRIEIIRGGRGSVLYGDNATGGVINIITKEGGEGVKAGANVSGGSYGTFQASAYAAGTVKDLSLRLSGNFLTTDGYRDNSGIESGDLGMHTVIYAKDFLKIDFSGGYHRDRTGLPGALKESDFAAGLSRTDTRFPNDFSDTTDYYFALNPEVYFLGENVLRLETSLRKRDFLSFSSGDWGNFQGDSGTQTTTVSPQLILKQDFGAIKNTLTTGIDYQMTDEDIVNDSLFFGVRSLGIFSLKKEDVGYYVHDEAAVTDALRLSAGYRYDRAAFSFFPSTPESISMSQNLYTAGVNYTYYKKSYAYASYSRGFRYPVLDELYSFFTNTINTSLVPQSSNDYEIGARHFLEDNFYVQVNVFRLDTFDEIFFNPVTYENENFDGKTRRDGIVVSFDAEATSRLTLRGSYTFTSAKIKSGMYAGNNIPNVPRNMANADVMYRITDKASAMLNAVYIGERPFVSDFANAFGNQDSYFVLNAKFMYQWKSLKAFLDINNITNKVYAGYGVIGGVPPEKSYYPSPERNFLVGISMTL